MENVKKNKKIIILIIAMCLMIIGAFCISGSDSYAAKALKAPSNVHLISKGYNYITIGWNKVSGAKKYILYRYSPSKHKYYNIGGTTKTSKRIFCYYQNNNYRFKIRAAKTIRGTQQGYSSKSILARTYAYGIDKVYASNINSTYAYLSWRKVNRVSKYYVYKYNEKELKYEYLFATSKTSAKVSGLSPNTNYTFAVKPYIAKSATKVKFKTIHIWPKEINFNKTENTMFEGSTLKLNPEFTPSSTTMRSLIWESSNKDVATVKGGVVKAVSNGTCVITATSIGDLETKTKCTITVIDGVSSAYSIPLEQQQYYNNQLFALGKPEKLALTASSGISDYSIISYSSLNSNIASVDNEGNVTGLSAGHAVIKVEYIADGTPGNANIDILVLGNSKLTIGGKEICFGMTKDELYTTFGEPTEKLVSPGNYKYYVYNASDCSSLLVVGFNEEQNKVVNFYAQSNDFAYRDFTAGLSSNLIKERYPNMVFNYSRNEYGGMFNTGVGGYCYDDSYVTICADFFATIALGSTPGDTNSSFDIKDESFRSLFGVYVKPTDSEYNCRDWNDVYYSNGEKLSEKSVPLNAATFGQSKLLWYITNVTRHRHDIPATAWSELAHDVATWKSNDMIDRKYFGHFDIYSFAKDGSQSFSSTATYLRHTLPAIFKDKENFSDMDLLSGATENIGNGCPYAWLENSAFYNSAGHRYEMLDHYNNEYGFSPSPCNAFGACLAIDATSPIPTEAPKYYWTDEMFSDYTDIGKYGFGKKGELLTPYSLQYEEWYKTHFKADGKSLPEAMNIVKDRIQEFFKDPEVEPLVTMFDDWHKTHYGDIKNILD